MITKSSILSRLRLSNAGVAAGARRSALSKHVATSLQAQFPSLMTADLGTYTFRKQRSRQHGAREDFEVYDASGVLRFAGRSFGSGPISFWIHMAE